MNNLSVNIRLLSIGALLMEMLFLIPIFVPFLSTFGFSMSQIILLESTFAAMMVILEIPTGFLADRFGRKFSIILSACFNLGGVTLLATAGAYWQFMLGEIIGAIGLSFWSGAADALLYDSLTAEQITRYKKYQGNMFLAGRLGGIASAIIGGYVATFSLHWPFYLSLAPLSLWLILTFFLKEPARLRLHHKSFEHFKRIVQESIVNNHRLRWFIIYSAIPTGSFLISFWFYQRYLDDIALPTIWFGLILAAMNLASGLGSKYAHDIEKLVTLRGVMFGIPLLTAGGWLIMSFIHSPLAAAIMLLTSFLWGLGLPSMQHYVQQLIGSDRRATILSAMSMLRRICFFMVAPGVALVVDNTNINFGFLTLALFVLIGSGGAIIKWRRSI